MGLSLQRAKHASYGAYFSLKGRALQAKRENNAGINRMKSPIQEEPRRVDGAQKKGGLLFCREFLQEVLPAQGIASMPGVYEVALAGYYYNEWNASRLPETGELGVFF